MIAFTDPTVHPASADFYREFPWEPVAGNREVRVDRIVEMRRMSLETLLESILAEVSEGGDIMVIFHGTQRGLSLPITRSQRRVHADDRVIGFLLDSDLTDSELAGFLLVNEASAANLRRLADSVRQLNLNCTLFRACNVGQNRAALQNLKDFFGSRTCGAPDLRDAYSRLTPGRPNPSTAYRDRWLARYSQTRVIEVPQNGWVALATTGIAVGRTSFRLHGLTDSRRSVGYLMDVWLSRLHSAHSFRGRSVPFHAIVDSSASFPLILPGEDGYTAHLVTI